MATITNGTVTVAPTLVTGWAPEYQVNTIEHELIGNPDPEYTFRTASRRRGTLRALFPDEAAATAAAELHRPAGVFTLTRAAGTMRYVVFGGVIRVEVDPQTQLRTTLEIPYREVP